MLNYPTSRAHPFRPALTSTFTATLEPTAATIADHQLGTLTPTPSAHSVEVRAGLYFTPAWDPEEEARASVCFQDLTPDAARHEAQMRVLQAARRRALHGVTWRFERLTVRIVDHDGTYLAIESLAGVASDLHPDRYQELREALEEAAHDAAQDWAILGLN
ncbi:hypothetical protein [Deinococcus sp. Leaf326]|uniref:hypothetical protein n=1 Tax=Deinococcus sp. Leaf326 TaxID=1736338 RepID=UPI0006F5A7E1|nr:hypothetical protein [Deinococcus sp. Leaf326]KQR25580.1 hypothetical protein ASF71_19045 [Deinococcus sp. Leaf326]